MKGLKDQGVPVVGAYCTYFPAEIARAMGAVTVGLCSVSDETIPDAEKDLPKNLCPLIKSSYGFAKTDKCPFFYFSDVVVGETTCDGVGLKVVDRHDVGVGEKAGRAGLGQDIVFCIIWPSNDAEKTGDKAEKGMCGR